LTRRVPADGAADAASRARELRAAGRRPAARLQAESPADRHESRVTGVVYVIKSGVDLVPTVFE